MVRINVQTPGRGGDEAIDIDDGEALLVGRDPDPSRLDAAPAGAGPHAPVRTATVSSPSVSANHVVARAEGEAVWLTDVGSRNGTWVRLPEGVGVRVPASEGAVALHLAAPAAGDGRTEEPEDARWTSRDDYAGAVVQAVEEWLGRRHVLARVAATAARRGGGGAATGAEVEPERSGLLPLASGHELTVVPLRTMDARWPQVLGQVWKYVARQNTIFAAEEETRAEGLILASEAMRHAHRQVVEAAARGARIVLLTGPSGSGKDGLARTYHRHSGRSGPFVARNCSMFNKDFLRSELFGAEEGAFTGAVHRIIGAVERAHGGTLFLDEVGDMPAEVQPMLLRFLDRGEYERMGQYGTPRTADVRIVCATNKDLREASRKGEFRADLWYRLSVQIVEVPPLRERFADVVAYLKSRDLDGGRTVLAALSPEALELVKTHRWDGNFRELANFVERLPRAAEAGGIDERTARRALEQVALQPPPPPAAAARATIGADESGPLLGATSPPADWARVAERAAAAFGEDYERAAPSTWDEVKEYVEKYLKPLLFAELSGAAKVPTRELADLQALADRLDADRGTAAKQVNRYFERFSR